jgi:lipoprotein-anchoring transpeptidase ErfK/SrfK
MLPENAMPRLSLRLVLPALALAFACGLAPPAGALEAREVNEARFEAKPGKEARGPDPFVVKAQTLLGRRSISPGVIDGLDGENYRKAIAQFRRQEKLGDGEDLDERVWEALRGEEARSIAVDYKITKKDAEYDYVEEIPSDYSKQAKMKRLGYTSPVERFAERFHMGENLLKALNPKASFKEGETIAVVSVNRNEPKTAVRRIEANKTTGMVVVYGDGESILASYPATIGSDNTPSPDGEHKVTRIAKNPTYHYDPEKNFQQGKNTEKLTLPPGPNNPVGSVWIALSKPTYGIHGAPEPSKVSKNSSHGCVRLTNWDAEELAEMIKPGVTVRFTD